MSAKLQKSGKQMSRKFLVCEKMKECFQFAEDKVKITPILRTQRCNASIKVALHIFLYLCLTAKL